MVQKPTKAQVKDPVEKTVEPETGDYDHQLEQEKYLMEVGGVFEDLGGGMVREPNGNVRPLGNPAGLMDAETDAKKA